MAVEASPIINYITYTPCATASLSLIGSSLTLLTIYRTRVQLKSRRSSSSRGAQQQWTTYHRLMVAISMLDWMLSLGQLLGPLPVPVATGWPGAMGTEGTCTFQAFLNQVGVTSFAYNAMLMIYYVFLLRYRVPANHMSSRVEPVMHFVTLGFQVSVTIAGFPMNVYNSQGPVCWVGVPLGCYPGGTMTPEECEQAAKTSKFFGTYLRMVPFMVDISVIVVALGIVALTVFQTNRRTQRFVFRPSHQPPTQEGSSEHQQSQVRSSSQSQPSPRQSNSSLRSQPARQSTSAQDTRQVIIQCVLYSLTFLNCMMWSAFGTLIEWSGGTFEALGKHLWITIILVFFFPIQGFFNFLIYIRPRYVAIRAQHPTDSRWFAVKEAVWYPVVSNPNERRSRSVQGSQNRKSSSDNSNKQHPTSSNPLSQDGSNKDVFSSSEQYVREEQEQPALADDQQKDIEGHLGKPMDIDIDEMEPCISPSPDELATTNLIENPLEERSSLFFVIGNEPGLGS